MPLEYNQFQRELRSRNIDPKLAYFLSLIYERLIETDKQVAMCVSLLNEFAGQLASFVSLHERTQEGIQKLMRGGRPDGVEVYSVANEPDED